MVNINSSQEYILVDDGFPRVFTIGDIHGCCNETATLLEYLKTEQNLTQKDLVVFVGDYIDRGPDSKGAIELMLKFKKLFPQTIFLKGNHEDMLLSYLGFPGSAGEFYLQNGGEGFLKCYDLEAKADPTTVKQALPKEHIEFLTSLDRYVIHPNFIVAHAGLNPLRDLFDQQNDDLFWIREEFIDNPHYFDKTIIFGHTPFEDLLVDLPERIGIDTGLVYGNKLSCLELISGTVYQIDAGGTKVTKDSKKLQIPTTSQISK